MRAYVNMGGEDAEKARFRNAAEGNGCVRGGKSPIWRALRIALSAFCGAEYLMINTLKLYLDFF